MEGCGGVKGGFLCIQDHKPSAARLMEVSGND